MTRPQAPRSTRSTARAGSRWRAAATSTRCAAGSRATATGDEPRAPRDAAADHPRPRAQVGRARDRRLAPALARPLLDQRPDPGGRLASDRARPVQQGQPAHGQQHPRARLRRAHRRLDRRDPGRPRPLRHDHARPLRLRQRPQALDPARRRGRHPRPRDQQDQRRLRVRRARADDRDRRELPRQRPRDQPPRRGRLQGLPRLHRLARRSDGEQQDEHLLAPVRQLLEGHPLQEGRERAGRTACARLRPRAEEHLRARRGRPRPRGPPAGGAERDRRR